MRPDFNRKVHCILGLPFDTIDLIEAVQHIKTAAINRTPCFLSTPNLNFLISSQSDSTFRNSVINSDLSIADGMPIVWIAHLLSIPIRQRVAGSDLFNKLRLDTTSQLSVYFFGGLEGVAETACRSLNTEPTGLVCAGFYSPGFGSVNEMSIAENIDKINASGADFLVVSLGAKKGQSWIEQNRSRITVPIVSHLGAVVNFLSGTVNRAPLWIQRSGLEWFWRIKEEPMLWRRYFSDGLGLLKLLFTHAIPYAWLIYQHKPSYHHAKSATFELSDNGNEIIIILNGTWEQGDLSPLRECFSSRIIPGQNVRIEMEHVAYVDSAFIGLLLLLYGDLTRQGKSLTIVKLTKIVHHIFRYTGAAFLINARQ
jgi:N-acetylglucosaminyldiphosphoundecaprenol N-acetyl-beta-D-mannosaminyltransferase